MNYLAHAYRFLDSPYFVAGVALPDWLSVVGREFRARSNAAQSELEILYGLNANTVSTETSRMLAFLGGIIQHHQDDQAFHQNETFILLSARLSVNLRSIHGPESSIRSGFLGHIIVELLLDDWLNQAYPELLEDYYSAVDSIDRSLVSSVASKVVGKEITGLEKWIDRFVAERFLEDYADDRRLLYRLNQVMKRVKLDPLGDETLEWLAYSREEVNRNSNSLLCLDSTG